MSSVMVNELFVRLFGGGVLILMGSCSIFLGKGGFRFGSVERFTTTGCHFTLRVSCAFPVTMILRQYSN